MPMNRGKPTSTPGGPKASTPGSPKASSKTKIQRPKLPIDRKGVPILLIPITRGDGHLVHTINGEKFTFAEIERLYTPWEVYNNDDPDEPLNDPDYLNKITIDNYKEYSQQLDLIYAIVPPVVWSLWSVSMLTGVSTEDKQAFITKRDHAWSERYAVAEAQYKVANRIIEFSHPNLCDAVAQ